MSSNPESRYIGAIDKKRIPLSPKINEVLAKSAEKVVVDYFNENFKDKGMRARLATPAEDSGIKGEGGKQIDAVVYLGEKMVEKPAMCMQITTARDPSVREKKIRQLMENPFVRLEEEMKREDTPIPKVVIALNHEEVASFLNNPDFSEHAKIWEKILNDIIKSLLFVLNITKNDQEKAKARELLMIFEGQRGVLH